MCLGEAPAAASPGGRKAMEVRHCIIWYSIIYIYIYYIKTYYIKYSISYYAILHYSTLHYISYVTCVCVCIYLSIYLSIYIYIYMYTHMYMLYLSLISLSLSIYIYIYNYIYITHMWRSAYMAPPCVARSPRRRRGWFIKCNSDFSFNSYKQFNIFIYNVFHLSQHISQNIADSYFNITPLAHQGGLHNAANINTDNTVDINDDNIIIMIEHDTY